MESNTFHEANSPFFYANEMCKVLKAACHLDHALKVCWHQYHYVLLHPLIWLLFTTWLQHQVADLVKVTCNNHADYLSIKQLENQSVQDYASKKQSAHG